MAYVDHKIPPPGRGAVCWFLFLSFVHLLPVPWFLAVAVGLAPASFLFSPGMASLFSTDSSALTFGGMLLAPALVIKEHSWAEFRSDVGNHDWLVRAAEQGHMEAAQELVLHPRSREENLRWLTVAAEGGMSDAQYQLYLLLLKPDADIATSGTARSWLEKAANHEHMDAQYDLGRYYLHGNTPLGIEKNLTADPTKSATDA